MQASSLCTTNRQGGDKNPFRKGQLFIINLFFNRHSLTISIFLPSLPSKIGERTVKRTFLGVLKNVNFVSRSLSCVYVNPFSKKKRENIMWTAENHTV